MSNKAVAPRKKAFKVRYTIVTSVDPTVKKQTKYRTFKTMDAAQAFAEKMIFKYGWDAEVL